jgi:adenylate kinase family enzyme
MNSDESVLASEGTGQRLIADPFRIAILGNSGSGKTTLARLLAQSSTANILDLDTVAWEPGQIAVRRDPDAAAHSVRDFCAHRSNWIVEGCYASLIQVALEFLPRLIFLDPGRIQCEANCRARPWEPHKYSSREEQDARLEFLLDWVGDYYTREGEMSWQGHMKLYDSYEGPKQHVQALTAA